MSTTACPSTQHAAVDIDELVNIIHHVGGGVRVDEIAYQLRRRGRPASLAAVTDALCEAERRGLVTPWGWTTGPEVRR